MTTLRTDSTHSGITIDYANGSGFVHGGSGPLTVYSDDEKAAINALTDANDDTYYLFLVKNVTKLDADGNRTIVSGYMPVGYQHGFIFEQFDVARTIAHELGHGVFALHHTFSANTESFRADEGTTNNLMDYTEHGATLNHKQWTWMHENHGKGLFGFLADEEEGESKTLYTEIKRTKFELINDNEESRIDDNDRNSCNKYPTYSNINLIQEGARWYYTFVGRQNNMKINVFPHNLSNNVILHSKDNRVVLSNIKKENNPITFTFSTNVTDTCLAIYSLQDSINGKQIDGLNIISCKPKHFNISVFVLQDSSKERPPNVKFKEIEDYFNRIYGAINVTATFAFDTVKMNFSDIFDRNGNGKVDKGTESQLLIKYNVNNNIEYKVYIIDLEITREGLNSGETLGGLAIRNANYPLMNHDPIAIVTTFNNLHVPSSVAHELGHLIFGLYDVFKDPLVPGISKCYDQFNIMDYVNSAGMYIYNERKLRAYQVIDIENKTP